MSNSGLGYGDIAKIRADHFQFREERVPDKDPGLSDAVEARVVELLNRGYTDQQIGSHHSLADIKLTDADVAKIRYRCLPFRASKSPACNLRVFRLHWFTPVFPDATIDCDLSDDSGRDEVQRPSRGFLDLGSLRPIACSLAHSNHSSAPHCGAPASFHADWLCVIAIK